MNDIQISVRRINEMEMSLTAFNSKRSLYADKTNLIVKKMGSSTLLIDENVPDSIYFNRIKGFGNKDVPIIDDILGEYASKQITPCFDLTPSDISMEVAQALMKRRYACCEQLAFLEVDPKAYEREQRNIAVEIVKVTEKNVEEFLNLIALSNGRDIEEDLAQEKANYFVQPYFKNFIAYINGQPSGMGSLFIEGKEGYIANDFTFLSYRGKGIHQALLDYRIKLSQAIGLTKVYTDVEFGSISHNNMLKLGFSQVFINSFWIKQE
ncbi:GNAT family N-acetyltransferase [Robertmurraya sp. P23]|uniref:GNAT family N-acetyltransferase n=1 Tax=Robertmurraya sp. P23 TaxID=3436931 RepID=UPI003D961D24